MKPIGFNKKCVVCSHSFDKECQFDRNGICQNLDVLTNFQFLMVEELA